MNALDRIRASRPSAPMLWVAAVMAVAILSLYVQLLHDAVARGDRVRGEQRAAERDKATNAGLPSGAL